LGPICENAFCLLKIRVLLLLLKKNKKKNFFLLLLGRAPPIPAQRRCRPGPLPPSPHAAPAPGARTRTRARHRQTPSAAWPPAYDAARHAPLGGPAAPRARHKPQQQPSFSLSSLPFSRPAFSPQRPRRHCRRRALQPPVRPNQRAHRRLL
jgi:hypothetical protein